MKSRRACDAEQLSLDIISTLPQSILETILCFLPTTKEAARTSILSREWRYKWTKIPKLVFKCHEIHEALLQHRGPIHELTIRPCTDCECFEFDQIILHLAKNHTLKKFKVHGYDLNDWHEMPLSVFSLHHLTDLYLFSVDLAHKPISNGFGSLRSLVLIDVLISKETLLYLLSNCPSLKTLTLDIGEAHRGDKHCTITELFECIPVIEHLTISADVFEWLVLDPVPQELSTSLFHLKHFRFEYMCSYDGYGLAFLLVLIKCSPNLEKIMLLIENGHECPGEHSVVWERYSDVCLEHLKELEIVYFRNLEPEMEFVKFVLARSPKLKKVSIRCMFDWEQKPKMLITLLQAPRASAVIITVT